MRKKRLIVLWAVSILMLCIWGCLEWWNLRIPMSHKDSIMGIAMVDNTDFLQGKQKYTAAENPGVYYEGTLLPYSSADSTVYVSQDYRTNEWVGNFSGIAGAHLYTVKDSYWESKAEAIRKGYTFPLWLVTEDGYYELSLAISGMPVIAINTQYSEEAEEVVYEEDPDEYVFGSEVQHYGTIQVYNPGVGTESYEITETYLRYHEKGASSLGLAKVGYSIKLQSKQGNNLDVSLLGMRTDNSWKLNALFNDSTRVREKTAAEIWELFDQAEGAISQPGPRIEYVELIKDNEYLGLYGLVEPVDEKKLQLDSNDILYKVVDESVPDHEEIQQSIDRGWSVVHPIRVRYPEVIGDYNVVWYPMQDYLNIFYRNYVKYGGGKGKVHIENVCDMAMFLMVTSASDNQYKNSYFAAYVDGQGNYKMLQVPWDLDNTFGSICKTKAPNLVEFLPDTNMVYLNDSASAMMKFEEDMNIETYLYERWAEYREDFLSTENILQMFRDNQAYLVETGVAVRESARWPEFPIVEDMDELIEYQIDRMEWLDEYFWKKAYE